MKSAKFYVYRNLHKGGFSIKYKGIVIARPMGFLLSEAEFRVSIAGQKRARVHGQRNVHAYIAGNEWKEFSLENFKPKGQLYYNPFKTNTFVDSETGKSIKNLNSVLFFGNVAYYN